MVKILVIDDEYLVRYALARILRREGYEVATAADGERGIAAFHAGVPDVVLADMALSEPPGGTIRQMRRERPEAKIVAIAHSWQVDEADARAMARRLAADDVIFRPFDTEELLHHLRVALGEDAATM